MSLSLFEAVATETEAFEVYLQYFAARTSINNLGADLANFYNAYDNGTLPTGWTASGDTITPTSRWENITADIKHDGSFTHYVDDSSIRWRVTLRGYNYKPEYYGPDMAICCVRKINASGMTSGWHLWWIGAVDGQSVKVDYRNQYAWEATIRGIDMLFDLSDSPRITVGAVNMCEGASVTASSTLATPGDEAGNGEFVGTTADVSPENIVDGRRSTVWISQYAPSVTGETLQSGNKIVVDEVFFKPVAGYDPMVTWWVELVNNSNATIEIGSKADANNNKVRTFYGLYTYTTDNQVALLCLCTPGGVPDVSIEMALAPGERMIICGDKRMFESYTGGALSAKYVIEAKSFGTVAPDNSGNRTTTYRRMDINPTNGFVAFGTPYNELTWSSAWDTVQWGSTDTRPNYVKPGGCSTAVDISNLQIGQSIRRKPSGKDTDAASDWVIEPAPRPGGKYEPDDLEWVQITLFEHTSTLKEDVTAGSTAITLTDGTLGWPESGYGIIESDVFSYTGRTQTQLTGIPTSGTYALNTGHVQGASVYPYANSAIMTGWVLNRLEVQRREGLSAIKRMRIYLSPYNNLRAPNETGWQSDYDSDVITYNWTPSGTTSAPATLTFDLTARTQRWVRTILIVIDEMTDGGRAKINEVIAYLDDAMIEKAGNIQVGTSNVVSVIAYILQERNPFSYPYAPALYHSLPTGWGVIGKLATAIAPVTRTFNDLAKAHGCMIKYHLDGTIRIITDPWWPNGRQGETWLYNFTEANCRSEVALDEGRPSAIGVALYATDTTGAPLQRVVVPPGVEGTKVVEHSGYTCSSQGDAWALAWNLYWREINTQRARLTVKGVGHWCEPLQRIVAWWGTGFLHMISASNSGDTLSAGGTDILVWTEQTDAGQWLIERVTTTWAPGKWRTELGLTKYFI